MSGDEAAVGEAAARVDTGPPHHRLLPVHVHPRYVQTTSQVQQQGQQVRGNVI